MAMDAVLRQLESRIEELVEAYGTSRQHEAELEAQVADLQNRIDSDSKAGERTKELEKQRDELCKRLESRRSRICAEAYLCTPHKEIRRSTPRLPKSAVFGRELARSSHRVSYRGLFASRRRGRDE
jgi:chromosome segregation ATPase